MHALLADLVATEASTLPFLSLYLDTRPGEAGRSQGRRQRNSLVWLKRRLSELQGSVPARGDARDSFDHDVEKVLRYLENELQPSTQGLALFACHGRNFFRAQQFQVPFDNHVALDEVPHVYPLARVVDGHEAYAVVLVDSERACIYAAALGKATQAVRLQHPLERPERATRTTSVGGAGGTFGAAELRYQRHLAGQVQAHFKEVVERLEAIVRQENLGHVILCGQESVLGDFEKLLPKSLHEKVVNRLGLNVDTPQSEVMRATLQLLEQHAREQASRRVEWLLQEHRGGGVGVAGLDLTLRALNEQNMDGLIVGSDFASTGRLCRVCDLLMPETGEDTRCRHCGGETRPIADLRETMVARAERQGAPVHAVDGHAEFRRYGSIGALLRYRRPAESVSD